VFESCLKVFWVLCEGVWVLCVGFLSLVWECFSLVWRFFESCVCEGFLSLVWRCSRLVWRCLSLVWRFFESCVEVFESCEKVFWVLCVWRFLGGISTGMFIIDYLRISSRTVFETVHEVISNLFRIQQLCLRVLIYVMLENFRINKQHGLCADAPALQSSMLELR